MQTAHVLSQKRVCFPSLDWKEEDLRTERGVNFRSQQKKEKKQRKQRKLDAPRLPSLVYGVLMDSSQERNLIDLASDPIRPAFNGIFTFFYQFLQGPHSQLFGQDGGTFSTRLLQLRDALIPFSSLDAPMINLLSGIGGMAEFQHFVYPNVSSESESDLYSGESKDENDDNVAEGDDDNNNLNAGDRSVAAVAPVAVPAAADNGEDGNGDNGIDPPEQRSARINENKRQRTGK